VVTTAHVGAVRPHVRFRPLVRFLRFYVLKLGLLEGWRGLWLACVAAHYVRLKYAKLLLLQSPPAPPLSSRPRS
jgi:hypothetical protein